MPSKIFYLFLTCVTVIAFTCHSSLAQTAEICDNALDDDRDGLIDLNDPDCKCRSTPVSHIPNPSFEETDCCPSGNAQLDCAKTWIQASEATTDYYNRCGYFIREQFPVPQPIPDGDAYIGFRNGRFSRDGSNNNSGSNSGNTGSTPGGAPDMPRNTNANWKEYTGACLLAPLEAGTEYTIQFYIGFLSREISPPMNVVLYGTTDCSNLPFGIGNSQFGCPLNGSGWQVLGQVYVSGNHSWRQYKITTSPRQDITAIAIGPDCFELDLDINPYYFLDHLILADSELFGPEIVESGHPCNPDFSILASDRKNARYQWYRDGVAIVGAKDRELQINGVEGDYQALMMKDSNCVLSEPYRYRKQVFNSSEQIIVCPEGTYRFGGQILSRSGFYVHTFQSVDGCDSIAEIELVVLKDRIDSTEAWFFQGEEYRAGPYRFHSPGTANLVLTSSIGCDSLVHLTLHEYSLYIPNAFTPNGDGINDVFTLFGSENLIDIQSMRIYDRWGNQVYVGGKDKIIEWDGSANGHMVEDGVYGYILEMILLNGQRKIVRGDITLIR